MNYRHLTLERRYKIETLRDAGWSTRSIAEVVGCDASTVSRELRRNAAGHRYLAQSANRCATRRRAAASARLRIAAETWAAIELKLREDWSPEQVSRRLRRERRPAASPERIYQHILSDRRRGGTLWRHLRRRKRWRKRYGSPRRRRFPNRRPIAERPAIVARRGRFGDWEGDTVQFATGAAVLVSLNERRTQFVRLAKSLSRKARPVTRQVLSRLGPAKADVHDLGPWHRIRRA
jgi:IS30 family transposase